MADINRLIGEDIISESNYEKIKRFIVYDYGKSMGYFPIIQKFDTFINIKNRSDSKSNHWDPSYEEFTQDSLNNYELKKIFVLLLVYSLIAKEMNLIDDEDTYYDLLEEAYRIAEGLSIIKMGSPIVDQFPDEVKNLYNLVKNYKSYSISHLIDLFNKKKETTS